MTQVYRFQDVVRREAAVLYSGSRDAGLRAADRAEARGAAGNHRRSLRPGASPEDAGPAWDLMGRAIELSGLTESPVGLILRIHVVGGNRLWKARDAMANSGEKSQGGGKPAKKITEKDYQKELKKLHVELVKLQEWVVAQGAQGLRRLRGTRRGRQGRDDQGDHRAGQPARLPRRGAAGADRAREVADVRAALHPALPGGRRGRHLRPQLVQPRGRRAGDGLLHRGAGRSGSWRWSRSSRRRWSTPGSSCSSTGSR